MHSLPVKSKLPVTPTKQRDENHCVPACLHSVSQDLQMTWDQDSIVSTFGFECYATREDRDNPSKQPPGVVATRHIPALILGMGLAYQVRFGKGVDALKSHLWVLKKPDGFILLAWGDEPNDESFDLSCDVDGTAQPSDGHLVRVMGANKARLTVMDPSPHLVPVNQRSYVNWELLATAGVYVVAAWDKPRNAWPGKKRT